MANASVVVPAIPPRPPQISLLGSALAVAGTAEPSTSAPSPEQLAALPADLRAELEARVGENWVRGFTYAPENHGAAWLRDRCDGTTYDFGALPTPTGLAIQKVASGGTLPAVAHAYQVTAVNAAGETLPCAEVSTTNALNDANVLTWNNEGNWTYKVYGRVHGSIGLLATVGPFPEGTTPTWTDTGSGAPGAAVPSSNTTGGAGTYTNPAIQTWIPYLIEVMDTCSSFGFEERDFKGRALRWLDNATPKAIEQEFMTGALSQAAGYGNGYLQNAATLTDLTPGGGPPSVARGLQILQDALATIGFGGQGMIHVQPQTAPSLLGSRRNGSLLLDVFDNVIVPGVGYNGNGPGNAAPAAGTAWMYATDLIMVRSQKEGTVFPDTFSEALDRGQAGYPNTITFRAERFACAYWDVAAHFAVRVTLAT